MGMIFPSLDLHQWGKQIPMEEAQELLTRFQVDDQWLVGASDAASDLLMGDFETCLKYTGMQYDGPCYVVLGELILCRFVDRGIDGKQTRRYVYFLRELPPEKVQALRILWGELREKRRAKRLRVEALATNRLDEASVTKRREELLKEHRLDRVSVEIDRAELFERLGI